MCKFIKAVCIILTAFALLCAASCEQKPAETYTPATEAQTSGETGDTASDTSSDTSPGQQIGNAPQFELYDQYGVLHKTSDWLGKVVFLNFWTTWCPPCRSEMPDIQALYEKYGSDGDVVIIGVAFPNNGGEGGVEDIKAFLEENGYSYPVLFDESGNLLRQYGIRAYPTTYMIDSGGNVFGYVTGALSAESMQSIIDQTIKGVRN